MSIHWQRFAGDTASFAVSISFVHDPDEGAGSTPEESASWGGLQIWVRGLNVCSHAEYGEPTSSVYWYLLPVLEWLANNWDAMLHEERLPAQVRGTDAVASLHATRFPPALLSQDQALAWEEEWQQWWQRHSLQTARDGGLLPDIVFRRWRDQVELSWNSRLIAGVPEEIVFDVPVGVARLSPEEIAHPLHDVLFEASSYLLQVLPASARLRQLSDTVATLRQQQRTVQRYAWLAGLGRTAESVLESWRRIERALAGRPELARRVLFGDTENSLVLSRGPLAAHMFGSVAPEVSEADVGTLLTLLAELVTDDEEPRELSTLVRNQPLDPTMSAAEHGYLLAEAVLNELGLADSEWIDIEAVLARLAVRILDTELTDARIRGLSIAGPGFQPAAAVNSRYPWADTGVRRFTLAHELCHLLFDRVHRSKLAVASGPWAPLDIERRAGGFAAMFLMPTRAAGRAVERLGRQLRGWDEIAEVAQQLRTSPSATLEHLHNLGLIDDFEYERLKDLGPRTIRPRR